MCRWVGTCMFFIERGRVRVMVGRGTHNVKRLGSLDAGTYFGEVALTSTEGARRAATVISDTLLICEKLYRAALEQVRHGRERCS